MISNLVPLLPGRTLRLIQCSEAEVLSFCVRLLLSSLKVIKSLKMNDCASGKRNQRRF